MIEYPRELVDRYGAKAGILMYVAKEFPDIPQAAMIVSEPGELVDNLLERADKCPILYPRLFRSSAVAELDGYEGELPTVKVSGFEEGHKKIAWNPNNYGPYRDLDYFNRFLRNTVYRVRMSPQQFKSGGQGQDLPDEINVIIAEKAPSGCVGTLVKHPNQDDYYLIALTTSESLEPLYDFSNALNPNRSAFSYHPKTGIEELTHFSQGDIELTSKVRQDLEAIIPWHDRIVALPEIDKRWTYQLEFGIDPPCLFQVRPFLRKQKADFRLKDDPDEFIKPIIFGVTSQRGITARLETDVWDRICKEEVINPDNRPSVLVAPLRVSHSWEDVPNLQGTILTECLGILAHGDIRAIRRSQVSILTRWFSSTLGFKQGDWVNIVSDGYNARVRKTRAPKTN